MPADENVLTRDTYMAPTLVVYGDITDITNGPKAKGKGANRGGGKGKNKAPRS